MFIDSGIQNSGTPLGVRCFRRLRCIRFRKGETDEHGTPKKVRDFSSWGAINIALLRSEDPRGSSIKEQSTKYEDQSVFSVQSSVHNRIKRKFRFSLSIEEQWIVCSTSNWPVIQPCISVRHSPEGDSVNDVTISQIHDKQLAISFSLLLLNSFRQTRSKWVEFALQFRS